MCCEVKFFYVTHHDDDVQDALMQRSREKQIHKRDNERKDRNLTDFELLESAIELILDVVDGRHIFWMVAPVFDQRRQV